MKPKKTLRQSHRELECLSLKLQETLDIAMAALRQAEDLAELILADRHPGKRGTFSLSDWHHTETIVRIAQAARLKISTPGEASL